MLIVVVTLLLSTGQGAVPVDNEAVFMGRGGYRLGVVVSDLDEDKANESGVKEGAYVLEVIEGSEAERIGLKAKDVITKIDGKKVKDADDLIDYVSAAEEDKEAALTIWRDGKELTLKTKLRKAQRRWPFHFFFDPDHRGIALPESSFHWLPGLFQVPTAVKGAYLGVQAKNLSKQLLSYFEVEHGVLIEEVINDSPAEKAGLKAGDVITKINDREIRDSKDLIRTINYFNGGEKVTVHYARKGSKKSVSVTLEKRKGPAMDKNIKIWRTIPGEDSERWIDSERDAREIQKEIRDKVKPALRKIRTELKLRII